MEDKKLNLDQLWLDGRHHPLRSHPCPHVFVLFIYFQNDVTKSIGHTIGIRQVQQGLPRKVEDLLFF